MLSTLIALLTFIVGVFFGVFYAKVLDVLKKVKDIKKKVEESKSHVTLPSYFPSPINNQSGKVVTPKTPQRLEFEREQRIAAELSKK